MSNRENMSDYGKNEFATASSLKPWEKPVLTRYGRMVDLTLPGGGPNPNDGAFPYGSPLVPTS